MTDGSIHKNVIVRLDIVNNCKKNYTNQTINKKDIDDLVKYWSDCMTISLSKWLPEELNFKKPFAMITFINLKCKPKPLCKFSNSLSHLSKQVVSCKFKI